MAQITAIADPIVSRPVAKSALSLRTLALSICAGALLLAWLPRLRWGLWTDEAGTYWMACAGWWEAISRSGTFPGQSVLYGVLESFFAVRGAWEEPLLRIPSVLAMFVAAWHLKKLAELLIGPEAGWLAVAPFFCSPEIFNFGTMARPYALATAAAIASFRYLAQWRSTPDTGTVLRYLVASVLTLYFHYLFGFIFVIQAAHLGFCLLRGHRFGWRLPVAALAVLPLSLVPLIAQLLYTAKLSGPYPDVDKPTFEQLLQLSFPPNLLLGAALGAALVFLLHGKLKWRKDAPSAETAFLVVSWMLLAPVLFFAIARFTPYQSLFVSRYLLFCLPAFLLALAWLISGFTAVEARNVVLLAIFGGAVLHPGGLLVAFRPASNSWREPLQLVAAERDPGPVFVTSGLIDTKWLDWRTQDPATSPLFSQMTAYPVPNKTIPLPFQFSKAVEDVLLKTDFSVYKSLFLVAAVDAPVASWLSEHLAKSGFRAEVRPVNDYVVIHYRR
jgi:hypothetical protein